LIRKREKSEGQLGRSPERQPGMASRKNAQRIWEKEPNIAHKGKGFNELSSEAIGSSISTNGIREKKKGT